MIDAQAITPTGRNADWAFSTENKRDPNVRDYNAKQIRDYILFRKYVTDEEIAMEIAENLHVELYDWNEGTDLVTTWDDLIRSAVRFHRERLFPRTG